MQARELFQVKVENLPPSMSCFDYHKIFSHIPVRSSSISQENVIFTFKTEEALQQALLLDNKEIDGTKISVKRHLVNMQGKTTPANPVIVNKRLEREDNAVNTTSQAKALLNSLFTGEKDQLSPEVSSTKRNAQVMFEKLYTSKKFADVFFDVQGEEILAHKAILAQESKYFEQLLSSQSKMAKIAITDVTSATFKGMLEYVYCDEVKPDENLIVELIKLSEKYSMPDMKLKCEHTLGSLISTENFVKIAKVIEEQQTPQLKDMLLNYTLKNGVDKIDRKELNEVPRLILIEMVEKLSERSAQAYQQPNMRMPFLPNLASKLYGPS